MDNGTVGTFEFVATPEDVEKFINLVKTGDSAGNEFQFVISGNPANCGCGGNGCCSKDEDKSKLKEQMFADRDKIFNEAFIAPYKDGEKMLFAFTPEQLRELECMDKFWAEEWELLNEEYCELMEEYDEAPIVPDAVRILRSGDRLIVFWGDGDKTIVKRSPDESDSNYIAFTAALGKKIFGTNSKLARFIKKNLEYQKPKEKAVNKIPEDIAEVFVYDDTNWTSQTVTVNKNGGSIYAE